MLLGFVFMWGKVGVVVCFLYIKVLVGAFVFHLRYVNVLCSTLGAWVVRVPFLVQARSKLALFKPYVNAVKGETVIY